MISIFGIRHHGVGSAKHLLAQLEALQPDMVLVEGPPELDAILQWVGQDMLLPPVAALCHDEARPQHSVFYPFSAFSPEWQAIAWANRNRVPVRMMDLPLATRWEAEQFGLIKPQAEAADPIGRFARIAGYEDADLWWEHHFEHRYHDTPAEAHFEAVMLMMQTLRENDLDSENDSENHYREAWMGRIIRQARNEMYQHIAVVCGAWHAPALLDLDKTEKKHQNLIRQLPKTKIKVGATWIPWTNNRLSYQSGYGAGIQSPGWYEHLWERPDDRGAWWLSHAARVFRGKNMDISTAHVIEACRLADALAGLRDLARPGLQEMNEATVAVMCMGDAILLELVRRELNVGDRLGSVPEGLPKLPLQADFEDISRKLRLPHSAEAKELKLDLRQELDLKRSVFLSRLSILGIPWAKIIAHRGKGTFREVWELEWQPEMMVALIEKGVWGSTVEEAATRFLLDKADDKTPIDELAQMINRAIPAELYEAVGRIVRHIQAAAVVSADVAELMRALLPIADLSRYGNVRKSDLDAIQTLLEGLTLRICIGLPTACYGLNAEMAQEMFGLIQKVNEALRTLEQEALSAEWRNTLLAIAAKSGVPPVLGGCTTRLLLDARVYTHEKAAQRFAFALSAGQDPAAAAEWLEGFLKSSGMILLYDDVLWNIVYQWVADIGAEQFTPLLPILRRSFAHFAPVERRQLGEKARYGPALDAAATGDNDHSFNTEWAEKALYLTDKLLTD